MKTLSLRAVLGLALLLLAPVSLRADEAVELKIGAHTALGTLRGPAGGTAPLVLLTHGTLAHKDMETITLLAKGLVEKGYATLAHNLTLGQDRRSGMFDCTRPHTARADDAVAEIGAWRSYAEGRGYRRIYLLGHSRGANQVARYLVTPAAAGIAGTVLLAPTSWGTEVRSQAGYAETYRAELPPLIQAAQRQVAAGQGAALMSMPGFSYCPTAQVTAAAFVDYYVTAPAHDTPTLIAAMPPALPVLVIGGGKDTLVTDIEQRYPEIQPLKAKLDIVMIADADHFFLDLAGEDAVDRIAAFIAAHP